ncbi:helix-turn-helix domain-containing protein [Mycobacterium asiaticum]|uniref:HTH cro/C1-type domain-containing protein n=1 Tax=Mycobacterium asiaticum TaxID=1790 RepID=A0A1A3KHY0_MYCAS|nr:helix-turn-helix domain-containing protein [Mycobacterium asiaticum]OBJ84737.1 hypothetical protein A5640_14990 [Mycobacterium asiaticum]
MSWQRLADEIRRRRKQLGLTQADVYAQGGPSTETLRALENNRAGRLTVKLRRALERALQWEAGSVDAILDGRPPRPLDDTDAPGRPAERPGGPPSTTATQERFAMAERLVRMRQAFASHRDVMPLSAREDIESELTAAAQEVEEALVWMLPWLRGEQRADAIRILGRLNEPQS